MTGIAVRLNNFANVGILHQLIHFNEFFFESFEISVGVSKCKIPAINREKFCACVLISKVFKNA